MTPIQIIIVAALVSVAAIIIVLALTGNFG